MDQLLFLCHVVGRECVGVSGVDIWISGDVSGILA